MQPVLQETQTHTGMEFLVLVGLLFMVGVVVVVVVLTVVVVVNQVIVYRPFILVVLVVV